MMLASPLAVAPSGNAAASTSDIRGGPQPSVAPEPANAPGNRPRSKQTAAGGFAATLAATAAALTDPANLAQKAVSPVKGQSLQTPSAGVLAGNGSSNQAVKDSSSLAASASESGETPDAADQEQSVDLEVPGLSTKPATFGRQQMQANSSGAANSARSQNPVTDQAALSSQSAKDTGMGSPADSGKESANASDPPIIGTPGGIPGLPQFTVKTDKEVEKPTIGPQKPAPSAASGSPTTNQMLSSPATANLATVAAAGQTPAAASANSVVSQVGLAIVGESETARQDGAGSIHLQLDPPGLGAVRIQLSSAGPVVNARLVVQVESTQHLLESNAQQLRDRLSQAGMTLGRFDVSHDSGGSGNDGQQTPPGPEASEGITAPATNNAPSPAGSPWQGVPRLAEGSIDIVA
jgi:flagellar hook-length control protein FliK